MRKPTSLFLALVLFASVLGAHAAESSKPGTIAKYNFLIDATQALSKFRALHFPKIEKHTSYVTLTEGLKASAVQSASGLIARFDEPQACPGVVLKWRWRPDEVPEGSGGPGKEGDDYAARMVAVFDYDPAIYSLFDKFLRLFLQDQFRENIPGAAMEYVWVPGGAPGVRWDNPYTDKAKMIAVDGELGRWDSHTARPCQDYRDAFHRAPPPIVGIFLMTDADDSQSNARAVYGSIEVQRE